MNSRARAVVAIFISLMCFLLLEVVVTMLLSAEKVGVAILTLLSVISIGLGWAVFRSTIVSGEGIIKCTLMGSVILGTIGSIAGFFGPLIFAPNSNQGPLLGIFITGPLGVFLGLIAGLVYWIAKNRRSVQ